jgi:hypothetical protein
LLWLSSACREQEEREERDRLRREGKPLPPELTRNSSDDYRSADDRGGRGGRGDFGMFGPPGSHDDSDPFTTNLYVGNIHPEVRFGRGEQRASTCYMLSTRFCCPLLSLKRWLRCPEDPTALTLVMLAVSSALFLPFSIPMFTPQFTGMFTLSSGERGTPCA